MSLRTAISLVFPLAAALLAGCPGSGPQPAAPNARLALAEGRRWVYQGRIDGSAGFRETFTCARREGEGWALVCENVPDDDPEARFEKTIVVRTTADAIEVLRAPDLGLQIIPADFRGKRSFEVPREADAPFTVSSQVSGEETVETPAGSFRCTKVTASFSDGGAAGTYTAWYAEGTGLVRSIVEIRVLSRSATTERSLVEAAAP